MIEVIIQFQLLQKLNFINVLVLKRLISFNVSQNFSQPKAESYYLTNVECFAVGKFSTLVNGKPLSGIYPANYLLVLAIHVAHSPIFYP